MIYIGRHKIVRCELLNFCYDSTIINPTISCGKHGKGLYERASCTTDYCTSVSHSPPPRFKGWIESTALMHDNGTAGVIMFSVKRGTRYLQDNIRDVRKETGSTELLGCVYKNSSHFCLESFLCVANNSPVTTPRIAC